MGASNYSDRSTTRKNTVREEKKQSEMMKMLELLEKVEECRENVEQRKVEVGLAQKDLEFAKEDLKRAEQRVAAQINNLEPETKARFRRMMNGMDEKEQDER